MFELIGVELLADHTGVRVDVETDGLGQLLVRAARNFQTVDMFEPIIAISLLGLLLNAAFNAVSARLLVGFPEQR